MAPINGFWGEPTSTIDWCEENYVVTNYIAEFWNTLSNLAIIIPSVGGFYYSYKNGLDSRIMFCFISLTFVGLGSWNFHMTLLYEMQLFDELPMLWGSLILLYVLMTHYYPVYEQNRYQDSILKFALFTYGLLSTIIYLNFKTPILFQASYGILVTWILYLDICLLKYKPCNKMVFFVATAFYHGGFILWLIDNFFCDQLRTFRYFNTVVPILVNPLTQLHAWWHVFAGYGAYLHILFGTHSRQLSKGRRPLVFKYVWCIGVALDYDGFDKQSKNCSYSKRKKST